MLRKILLAVLLLTGVAEAQTTQPTYIRPSKGNALTLWTKKVLPAKGDLESSPVLDFTAFSAMQIRTTAYSVATGAAVNFSQCVVVPLIGVMGSLTKDGPFQPERDSFAFVFTYPAQYSSYSYNVNTVSSYNRLDLGQSNGTGMQDCVFTIAMTPLPLQTAVGELITALQPNTSTVASLDVNSKMVFAAVSVTPYLRLQNVGTNPVVCIERDALQSGLLSLTRYSFALSAGTADHDGTGGSVELKNLGLAAVDCMTTAGTSKLAIFYYRAQ